MWRSGGGYFVHSMKKLLLLLFTELPAFGTKTNQARLLLPRPPVDTAKDQRQLEKEGGGGARTAPESSLALSSPTNGGSMSRQARQSEGLPYS